MMTVCFCLLDYLLLLRRGFVPGGFKNNSMKSISESLRVFATAAQQAAVVLAALVPIIEAIDRAERRRKQLEVLILKSYTLGLTFNEAQRLKKMQ